MSLIEFANKIMIKESALFNIFDGQLPVGIANYLDLPSVSLQKFIDGEATSSLASHLGCTTNALQELRDILGKNGAIGLLLGLCLK